MDRLLLENGTDALLLEDGSTFLLEPPPQFGRPDAVSDVSGSWTGSPDNTDLHTNINEVTPSDAEFVTSPNNPGAGTFIVFSISNLNTPDIPTQGHVFRYLAGKDATSGRTIDLTVALMQGTTEVASWAHLNIDPMVTYEQVLTTPQAAAITDYQDLRFRFDPTVTGGGGGRAAVLAWAELEVPYGEAAQDFPRTAIDSVSSTESLDRLVAAARAVEDAVTIGADVADADHQTGAGDDFPRSVTDSLTTSDTLLGERRGPPQFVVPVADVATDAWTAEDGRSSALFPSVADASDATYVRSPSSPTSTDVLELSLESAVDPQTEVGHVVHYRYSAEGPATLVLELVEGSTVLDTWQHVDPPATPTDGERILSEVVAAAITNYADLRIRLRGP